MARRTARKMTFSSLETLEDRIALSASTINPVEALVDAKAGPILGTMYSEYVDYVASGGQGAFNPSHAQQVETFGSAVGVDVQFSGGSLASNVAQMKGVGMLVTATVPSLNIVEGVIPLSQLPSVAVAPNEAALTPVYRPSTHTIPVPGTIAPNVTAAAVPTPAASPTLAQLEASVSLKGGPALETIYQDYINYLEAGGTGTFTSSESSQALISGTSVGVDINTSPASFGTMLTTMEKLGMQVTATDAPLGIIEGFLPIAQLPAAAAFSTSGAMAPVYRPFVK